MRLQRALDQLAGTAFYMYQGLNHDDDDIDDGDENHDDYGGDDNGTIVRYMRQWIAEALA